MRRQPAEPRRPLSAASAPPPPPPPPLPAAYRPACSALSSSRQRISTCIDLRPTARARRRLLQRQCAAASPVGPSAGAAERRHRCVRDASGRAAAAAASLLHSHHRGRRPPCLSSAGPRWRSAAAAVAREPGGTAAPRQCRRRAVSERRSPKLWCRAASAPCGTAPGPLSWPLAARVLLTCRECTSEHPTRARIW